MNKVKGFRSDFHFSSQFKSLLWSFFLCGLITFSIGLFFDPKRIWAAFLQNHFYFMSLALGGLFFAVLQWTTGAIWSAVIRRFAESFTAYLPVVFLSFLILACGISHLYGWSHSSHVQGDLVLEGKASYLNSSFFILRNFLAIVLWIFLGRKMVSHSLAQDRDGDRMWTEKNRILSPIFLMVFALTFTMASFDQLMSLDAHWFSTIYGVYCFAGLFYSTLALLCLFALFFRTRVFYEREGVLVPMIREDHLHDLGKFLFAFSIFWAYIAFSQFLLIWYANLPEETGYFMRRMQGPWMGVSWFLLLGKFLLPFFFLLTRSAKRNPRILAVVSSFMLFAHWIDMLWLIQPEFFEGPRFLMELGIFLGFLGIFGIFVLGFLEKNACVVQGDPTLKASLEHHQ
jgi:hypothetical protein